MVYFKRAEFWHRTGNIVASELTASRARDATRVPALLTQIQAPLVSVAADSAYDKEAVYEAIEAHSPGRRTRVVIPPPRNATLSQNSNTAMQERDRHIRAIERHGRREWYKLSGYTKRSMVENAVYRYKAIIGPEMRARTLARQRCQIGGFATREADILLCTDAASEGLNFQFQCGRPDRSTNDAVEPHSGWNSASAASTGSSRPCQQHEDHPDRLYQPALCGHRSKPTFTGRLRNRIGLFESVVGRLSADSRRNCRARYPLPS